MWLWVGQGVGGLLQSGVPTIWLPEKVVRKGTRENFSFGKE